MGKLFGTDGIRGAANTYPITSEVALRTGQAIGVFCRQEGFSNVVIGKDTRQSGDMLEAALCAGVASTGVDVLCAGVIPTPGIAFLCGDIENVGAGIVISASHNPYQDNGIKIFKHGGVKLSDSQEERIEDYILGDETVKGEQPGRVVEIDEALERYARFLIKKFPVRKQEKKLKLVVDCSNGSASKIGQMVFNPDLFDAVFIHNTPDGKNINDNCGSQHTDDLKKIIIEKNADLGLAFDGDADRLIAVDETGAQISGDTIIAICAIYAKKLGQLANQTVVSTIMSNIGLTKALEANGIRHLKSDVGDRRVLEEMIRSGAVVGGEDSGHMIFLNDHSTGDGMLSALKLIEAMLSENKPLSELKKIMKTFPQILMNVEVDVSRPDYTQNYMIADTIKSVEASLGGLGRVLVRYSGTQPMIRVMVEGPDQVLIETYCKKICDSIKENL